MLTKEYMVAFIVARMELDEEFVVWPLHITILPWFHLDSLTFSELSAAIGLVAKRHKVHRVFADGEGWFGPRQTVPIRTLKNIEPLMGLHEDLLKTLVGSGIKMVNTNFTGENFTPHITIRPGKDLKENAYITIHKLDLIEAPIADPRTRTKQVVGQYKLES